MAVRSSVGKEGEGLYQTSSGLFCFSVRIPVTKNGKRVKKQKWINLAGAKNLTEARALRKKIEGQDEIDIVVDSKTTFFQLAQEAFDLSSDWKARTREVHEKVLRLRLEPIADQLPAEITAIDFYRLVLKPMKKQGLSTASLAMAISTANIVFSHGVVARVCPRNPVRDLDAKYRKGADSKYKPRVVTADEFARIIANTRDANRTIFTGLHFRVCFGLFMLCGLRLGEALALQWGDIDWEKGEINVCRSLYGTGKVGTPKTASSASSVELPAMLALQLRQLQRWGWENHASPTPYVLAGKGGQVMARATAASQLKVSAERANLKGELPSPHDLRHSFGSALMGRIGLDPAVTIAYVSAQMRHANPNITLSIYTHVWVTAEKSTAIDDIFDGAYEQLG